MARNLCKLSLLLATVALALKVSPTAGSESEDPIVGGLWDADIHSQEVCQALEFAVKVCNHANNDLYLSRVVKVLDAQQQVVGGMNYYFDVELGRTACTKSQSDVANCPLNEEQDEQKREVCSFVVSTIPWLDKISILSFSCHSA